MMEWLMQSSLVMLRMGWDEGCRRDIERPASYCAVKFVSVGWLRGAACLLRSVIGSAAPNPPCGTLADHLQT
jgi:hypothetical protein